MTKKKAKPCSDCGRLPKRLPQHRCEWCILKRQPSHVQAEAAKLRREAVPEHLRAKRNNKHIILSTPPGTSFCAGCQSYMPGDHFGKGQTQCRGCVNAKGHEKRNEATFGITSEEYAQLLEFQGGKCAICRSTPRTVRLAVDHKHGIAGKQSVRGLLCSKCNHEVLGGAKDDVEIIRNALIYLETTPATVSGLWTQQARE